MLAVEVSAITFDFSDEQRAGFVARGMSEDVAQVSLTAGDGRSYSFYVMRPEARAIGLGVNGSRATGVGMNGKTITKPMTHDLLLDVVAALKAQVVEARLLGTAGMTVLGELVLAGPDGSELVLEARPSDAIAIAVRKQASVLVAEELLT